MIEPGVPTVMTVWLPPLTFRLPELASTRLLATAPMGPVRVSVAAGPTVAVPCEMLGAMAVAVPVTLNTPGASLVIAPRVCVPAFTLNVPLLMIATALVPS